MPVRVALAMTMALIGISQGHKFWIVPIFWQSEAIHKVIHLLSACALPIDPFIEHRPRLILVRITQLTIHLLHELHEHAVNVLGIQGLRGGSQIIR